MPVIQALTRAQLRRAVGYNLGAVREGTLTGNSSPSVTTLIDTSLPGDADDHIGRWVIFNSGTNAGRIRRVSDDNGTGTLTVTATSTALASPAAGNTYELWNQDYNPTHIHNLINMALVSATGKVFDPREDVSLFADGKSTRFSVPDDFYMLNRIYYRSSVPSKVIHKCDRDFDESVDGNFTTSLDTTMTKKGSSSLKIVVAGGASAGNHITDSITSVDISDMTHLEGWIRCSLPASAGNLVIHLDDGVATTTGDDKESLDIPALSADTWTYFHVALENWENDTAIASIGFEYDADIGGTDPCTIWLDDIKCVNHDEAVWKELHRNHWSIDNEERDIVLSNAGRSIAGYNMLKLVGGNRIATLGTAETSAAETAAVEVPESYVINRVTGQALSAASEVGGQRAESRRSLAGYWLRESNREMKNFPFITNGRLVHTS